MIPRCASILSRTVGRKSVLDGPQLFIQTEQYVDVVVDLIQETVYILQ